MNGRIYDPVIARFLSPDPYVQAPESPQNYNRYSYCLNNPLKYTDPSGEYALIDDIIAAAFGGVVNLIVNACQGNLGGHGFWGGFGRGLAAFGAGAVAGWGALYPEFGGWAWGGLVVGATNAWLSGANTIGEIGVGAGIGMASSILGGFGGQIGAQMGGVVVGGLKIVSPVIQSAISGTIGGGISGYMGGFVSGLIMTGDIEMAHIYGRNGFFMGMGMGLVSGTMSGYVYAKTHNINPWGEKSNVKAVPKYDYSFGPNDGNNIVLI